MEEKSCWAVEILYQFGQKFLCLCYSVVFFFKRQSLFQISYLKQKSREIRIIFVLHRNNIDICSNVELMYIFMDFSAYLQYTCRGCTFLYRINAFGIGLSSRLNSGNNKYGYIVSYIYMSIGVLAL